MNINQRIRVFLRAFNSTFEFRTGEMKKKKKIRTVPDIANQSYKRACGKITLICCLLGLWKP